MASSSVSVATAHWLLCGGGRRMAWKEQWSITQVPTKWNSPAGRQHTRCGVSECSFWKINAKFSLLPAFRKDLLGWLGSFVTFVLWCDEHCVCVDAEGSDNVPRLGRHASTLVFCVDNNFYCLVSSWFYWKTKSCFMEYVCSQWMLLHRKIDMQMELCHVTALEWRWCDTSWKCVGF